MTERDARAALFEKLILPHEKSLYAPALALTRTRADAEDLVQETMLRAFDRFETFRPDQGSPLAWLQTIQRHVFISGIRKKSHPSRTVSLDVSGDVGLLAPASATTSAERQALARIEARAVLSAIRALPRECRQVVYLSDVEGLTYFEIAALLLIPEGTVRSRLSRGRARVRRALFPWHFDEMSTAPPKRRPRSVRLTT